MSTKNKYHYPIEKFIYNDDFTSEDLQILENVSNITRSEDLCACGVTLPETPLTRPEPVNAEVTAIITLAEPELVLTDPMVKNNTITKPDTAQ